jgi:hypothetical protein
MRLGQAIFAGTMAALLTLAAPTLARNAGTAPHTAKASEEATSAPCRAYQKDAEGAWVELPCHEMGATTQSRSPAAPQPNEGQ